MIHLYCGDGKGKTTAAVGQAVRASGSGLAVCFCQFMKGQETGEIAVLSGLAGVTVLRPDFSTKFTYQMSPEERAAELAKNQGLLERAIELSRDGAYDLMVLDEAVTACDRGMIEESRLRTLVAMYAGDGCASTRELVFTGSLPETWMIDAADYVTDMEKIKHPFDKGIKARKGIEY